MSAAALLIRPLECVDTARAHWTIPAGHTVTVHHLDRCTLAVLDGRVYRTTERDIRSATAMEIVR